MDMNPHPHAEGCGSDVAAYALGALTDAEARRFEAHLETCDLCRTDLAGLRPVVAALPAAAEAVMPPPALKGRIMQVVESEARERERAAERAQRQERAQQRGSRFSFINLRPIPAMAAACALLLLGIGIGIATIDGEKTSEYRAAFIRGEGAVAMRVDDGHATLKVESMDQPPRRRVYQVWTQRFGEKPEPTDALFTVDKDGSASVDVPGDMEGVDQVLVTDEPPGGSEAPTTAPYFAVRISS